MIDKVINNTVLPGSRIADITGLLNTNAPLVPPGELQHVPVEPLHLGHIEDPNSDVPLTAKDVLNTSRRELRKQLNKMFEELAEKDVCKEGHVRLWRVTIERSKEYKAQLAQARQQVEDGTFTLDTSEKKALLDAILEEKDKVFGRYYSDSLEATLPHFLRHADDRHARRTLSYIDVPVETAQSLYFENVAQAAVGAIHRQERFDQRLEKANDKQDVVKHREDAEHFFRAFMSCKFEDIKDQFYLTEELIKAGKKDLEPFFFGHETCKLSVEDWQHIGHELDSKYTKHKQENRVKLREVTKDKLEQAWFGPSITI